ncbi:MAG: ABC transporter permease [Actinomycetota bacterium]
MVDETIESIEAGEKRLLTKRARAVIKILILLAVTAGAAFVFYQYRVPLGDWIESAVRWLTTSLSGLFDWVSNIIEWMTSKLEDLLLWPPVLVICGIFALIGWKVRRITFGAFCFMGFLLIYSMLLWNDAMSTLSLVLVASILAVAIGIPLGILAGKSETASKIFRPILDFMQTMPAFVYLIPAIMFFGIGKVPGVFATVIFAMPPAVRLTELGIRQVDQEVVEAAEAFGAPPFKVLRSIQVPLAMPTIMAGVNQVIMLALSMVVIAGIVGAGGLGAVVYRGVTRLNIGLGFEGGIAVVILAIFLDRITVSLGQGRVEERAGTA